MSETNWDVLWINATIATCVEGYGLLRPAAIAIKEGNIAWIGTMEALAKECMTSEETYDAEGRTITPGFIDCHTHVIYSGNRAHEFEQRLQGVSYAEITAQGGGIYYTVDKTREATMDSLLKESLPRVRALMASGVTTLEIKSGYGLDWENELKLLRVASAIEKQLPVSIYKTFLGAHTIPREYQNQPDRYVERVCHEMIPLVAKEKLAEAVDVFCENIAFNLAQTERIFKAARESHLAIKCHAAQLSNNGSALLAAQYGALSADHLEYATETCIAAMARAGTVAVLLPGAFYYLRETQLPPIDLLRQLKVPMAIASDCNPGTSPLLSLPLAMNMACVLFNLSPMEALLAVTQYAAKALGRNHLIGSLEVGKRADLIIWEVSHPREIVYYIGNSPIWRRMKNGQIEAGNA